MWFYILLQENTQTSLEDKAWARLYIWLFIVWVSNRILTKAWCAQKKKAFLDNIDNKPPLLFVLLLMNDSSPHLDDMDTPALPLTPHPECLVPAGAGHQQLLVTLVTYPHLKYRALIGWNKSFWLILTPVLGAQQRPYTSSSWPRIFCSTCKWSPLIDCCH